MNAFCISKMTSKTTTLDLHYNFFRDAQLF